MRVVGNAEYRTYLSMPWGDIRGSMRSFTFYENMGSFTDLYMSYWFSVCTASGFFVSGWEHAHPKSIYFLFQGCSGVTTIKVDSTWVLPSGLSSFNKASCFYGSTKLVGGNGTAFDSSKASADMAVIDTADTPGYLTAG